MFNDANGTEFKKGVIASGYTDGRLGINGLASHISLHYKPSPYDKGTLFLFCGRRFLELLATDAEKDRLIKNLSERLNLESV